MMSRIAAGWQLILADLALILFLVTLAALASSIEHREEDLEFAGSVSNASSSPSHVDAPVQALYRVTDGVAPFGEWLANQPNDPRAQLTIYASYSPGAQQEMWQKVGAMVSEAAKVGLSARVTVEPAAQGIIYAKFAFDRHDEAGMSAGITP